MNPATEQTKIISDRVLLSLFNKHSNQRTEAIEKYNYYSAWQIDAEMSQAEYFNKLNSTVIWLSIARKYKIVEFTEQDAIRLEKAIEFVGTKKNDPNANLTAAIEHYKTTIKKLKEKREKEAIDKAAVADPSVSKHFKGVLNTE